MFERLPTRRIQFSRTAFSALVHALLLFSVARVLRDAAPVRVLLPGTMKGTRIDLTYNPGRAPVPAIKPDRQPALPSSAPVLKASTAPEPPPVDHAALAELSRPHLPPLRQSATVTNSPASPAPDNTAGSDSFGSGDVQIALSTYSPRPRPDLSTLPRGTEGDVVLDVTIDPTGKVADLQILRGLGYGVENKVMETVRTWKFHPATRDGVAVASVQELHFHFGPV